MSVHHPMTSTASFPQTRRHHAHEWEHAEEERSSLNSTGAVSLDSGLLERQILEPRPLPKATPKRDHSAGQLKKDPHRQQVEESSGKREREHSPRSKHQRNIAKRSLSRSGRSGLFKTISGFLVGTIEVVPKRSKSRTQSRHRKESPADNKHQLKGRHSTDSTEKDNWSPTNSTTEQNFRKKEKSGSRAPKFRGHPEEAAAMALKSGISFRLPATLRTPSLTSVASQTVEGLIDPEEYDAKVIVPQTPKNSTATPSPDDKTMPPHVGWAQTTTGASSFYQNSGGLESQMNPPTPPTSPPPPQPSPTSAPQKPHSSLAIKNLWSSISAMLNPIPRTPSTVDKATQTEPLSPKQRPVIMNNSHPVSPESLQHDVSSGHQPPSAAGNNRPSEPNPTVPQENRKPRQETKRSHTPSRRKQR